MLLFFPSLVLLIIASLDIDLLEKLLWPWFGLNVVCSFLAAAGAVTPSRHQSVHVLKISALGVLLFALNLIVGFFGGCACAGITEGLRH